MTYSSNQMLQYLIILTEEFKIIKLDTNEGKASAEPVKRSLSARG